MSSYRSHPCRPRGPWGNTTRRSGALGRGLRYERRRARRDPEPSTNFYVHPQEPLAPGERRLHLKSLRPPEQRESTREARDLSFGEPQTFYQEGEYGVSAGGVHDGVWDIPLPGGWGRRSCSVAGKPDTLWVSRRTGSHPDLRTRQGRSDSVPGPTDRSPGKLEDPRRPCTGPRRPETLGLVQ